MTFDAQPFPYPVTIVVVGLGIKSRCFAKLTLPSAAVM